MTTGSEQAYPDYIGRNQKAWSDKDSDYAATMHAKWAGEAGPKRSGRHETGNCPVRMD
jgi:hypothetical protein